MPPDANVRPLSQGKAMREELVRLGLELVGGSEPIKGSLVDGSGERRAFHGWMELAAVLEALLDAAEPTGGWSEPAT